MDIDRWVIDRWVDGWVDRSRVIDRGVIDRGVIDPSTHRPIDPSVNRSIDRPTHRPIDRSTDRSILDPISRASDTRRRRRIAMTRTSTPTTMRAMTPTMRASTPTSRVNRRRTGRALVVVRAEETSTSGACAMGGDERECECDRARSTTRCDGGSRVSSTSTPMDDDATRAMRDGRRASMKWK